MTFHFNQIILTKTEKKLISNLNQIKNKAMDNGHATIPLALYDKYKAQEQQIEQIKKAHQEQINEIGNILIDYFAEFIEMENRSSGTDTVYRIMKSVAIKANVCICIKGKGLKLIVGELGNSKKTTIIEIKQ